MSRVEQLLTATRPPFLTASALPVIVGTVWGVRVGGGLDVAAFALALCATVLVHAAGNVFNDVGDELQGSDRRNTELVTPYTGGSRVIQRGWLSVPEMLWLSAVLTGLGMLAGAVLAVRSGPGVLLLGLAGIALAAGYSAPRVQLHSRGLGELAVGIAFGILPVSGAAWLQSGRFEAGALLLAVPVAAWVTDILMINEIPDRAADAAVGKRNLVVRLGVRGGAWLYLAAHALGLGAAAAGVVLGILPWPVLVVVFALGLAALPVALRRAAQGGDLRRDIERTLAIHAVGCIALALCAGLL